MSDTIPPPVGPRGLAIRAARQGEDAFNAGKPLLACPYGPTREYARRAWCVGYAAAELAAGVRRPEDLDEVDDDAPTPSQG